MPWSLDRSEQRGERSPDFPGLKHGPDPDQLIPTIRLDMTIPRTTQQPHKSLPSAWCSCIGERSFTPVRARYLPMFLGFSDPGEKI
jgi:hypothetical protein